MSRRFFVFFSRLPIDEIRGLPRAQPSRTPLSAPCWLASRVLIYHLRDLIFLYAGMSSATEPLPEPCPEHVEGSKGRDRLGKCAREAANRERLDKPW